VPEVLRVIARLNLGGPARHVLRIQRPLEQLGWRSHVVTGHVEPGERDLIDEARAQGLPVTVLPALGRALSPRHDLAAWRALRRLLRQRRPAVLHTHTAKAGALGRLAAGRELARVHSFHGHVLTGTFGPLGSAAAAAVERRLARRCDALVAVSERVAHELCREHGVGRPDQWHVIPPGIDGERTRADPRAGAALRGQLDLPDDAVLVGVVGRLTGVKRPLLALDTFARLSDPRAWLLVIGDGDLGAAVRARLADLPRTRWLEPRRDLAAVWGALDLLLLPSANEGLPQAVVESLRAGVPVVASDVGGLAELVQHGRDGLLVPADDSDGLAAALARLVSDERFRHAAGDHARARDWSAHTASAVAARLAALYTSLCPGLEPGPASGQTAPSCAS